MTLSPTSNVTVPPVWKRYMAGANASRQSLEYSVLPGSEQRERPENRGLLWLSGQMPRRNADTPESAKWLSQPSLRDILRFRSSLLSSRAGVVKLADARDSKSRGVHAP